ARALLDRGRRPASLTLVDSAPAMLARAHDRVAHAPCPLVVLEGDARALPLPDRCADLVGMGFLLHLLGAEDRAAVLDEARRVLATGGRLVAVAHASPRGVAGVAHRALWRSLRAGGGDVVGGGPMADVGAVLEAGGLRVEAVRRIPGAYWCQAVRARSR
ncbi:MAG: class I SAM-dependent methyltransferase, partial [Miltoncostaeaceae bacterium]